MSVLAAVARESGGEQAPPAAEGGLLLSVIVPVYNEARTIDAVLRRVLAGPYGPQILVVNDGSTDGTADVLAAWDGHPQIVLLNHARNRGKGAAIRTGLEHARGQYALIQDADLEYDPQDYPRLIEPLRRGVAQVVYGSRYLPDPEIPPPPRRVLDLGIGLLNLAVRLLYGVRLTDETTCYKAFPTRVLRAMDLRCARFEFCPEVTAKACRMGLTILEVPVRYAPRGRHEGKKLRWSDGRQALAELWRWRRWSPVGRPSG